MSDDTEGVVEVDINLIDWFKLECIELGQDWRLRRIDGATCDDIELVLGVKLKNAYLAFVRDDAPDEVVEQIRAMPPRSLFTQKNVRAILYGDNEPAEIRQEFTYVIETAPKIDLAGVIAWGDTPDTFDTFVILDGTGAPISKAWSIRRNDTAAEVAVETAEEHRGQGLAPKVVAAWAESMLKQGKVCIYSHRKGNEESRAVAKTVGATPFAEVISYY